MYEIYKISEDRYQVHSSFSGHTAMEGTLLAIMTYCVKTLDFKTDELEIALVDMLRNDKDAVHFGLNRTFIYAFNRNEKYGRTG